MKQRMYNTFYRKLKNVKLAKAISNISYCMLLADVYKRQPVRVAHAHSAPCGRNMKMIMRLYFRRKLQKYCTHKVACGEKAAKWLFGSDADLVEMESFVKGEKHSKNTVVLMKNAVDTDKFSYSTDVREKVRKKMKISRRCV